MNKVRFGIIGLGNQGSHYAINLFDKGVIENGVVSAMCDINPAKINKMKNSTKTEGVAYFENYIEMLDSGLCDAVLVEVPHYQYPEMVMECLKRNIHVICEKPAGVYSKQVKEMNEAAKNSTALFGMMFNQRTNPAYQKMREIVCQGGIGELQRVTWIITDWYRPQKYYDTGSWRATWEGEGGGVLFNQCPHQLDLVSWVVGELPTTVRGFCQYGRWHDIEVEDEVTAYFEYKNGATGMFITTTGETPGTNRFEISGTKGKLLCEGNVVKWFRLDADSQQFSNTTASAFGKPSCQVEEFTFPGPVPHHTGIINNFANAILGKEELFVGGEEGINGVELMNAISYSGWMGGEAVSLPVDEDKYLEELNKRRATSRLKQCDDNAVANTAGSFGAK